MAKTGLGTYSLAFSLASRNDVRSLFQYCIEATIQLDEESLEVLKNKGLYIRPPYISYPEKVQFVHKKIFLSGFTTQKRPLSALEITHLFANFDMNTLVHMLMIGFAQVTDSKDVQKIFFRGQRISEKHKNLF